MKKLLSFPVILICISTNAQVSELYHIKKDSSGFELTEKGASFLASLPMKCILQQYPNKTNHTARGDSDQVLTPRQLHPAFFGCFDWHSSVHGHWMLVRLLKLFPQLPEAENIKRVLNTSLTKENITAEVNYFKADLARGWERTYGWAWILKLDEELASWNNEDARRWHEILEPLSKRIIELWLAFLPKQTYPNRTGVHPNTAFGLVFALEYAKALKNTAMEKAVTESAKRLYRNDKNAPAIWEPDGSDFLSPSLEEADLMRRILPAKEFLNWFNHFMTNTSLQHLVKLPVVSDRTDLQIVHLDGLSFSRSWCMRGLASALPKNDPRKKLLVKASMQHLASALPNVVSGNYGGEHWLASFAVNALSAE